MNSTRRFQRLTASDASAWLAVNPEALILDARDARQHELGNMPGSVRLDGRNHERLLMTTPKDKPVFIYCYHGNSSQTYAEMFADFGFAVVADLIGGWDAWHQASLLIKAASPVSSPARPVITEPLRSWLREKGLPDAHTPGAHGNTPLMEAAWRGQHDIVEALLAEGVNLSAVNGDGNNALWLACVSNDPALVIKLAQAGVPIDHINLTGATCLMYAASSSKPDIVRVLLALGADPMIQTQDDYTALDMAATIECLQLLRAATRSATKAAA
jgi:rhodanese-related sulfurtransferase